MPRGFAPGCLDLLSARVCYSHSPIDFKYRVRNQSVTRRLCSICIRAAACVCAGEGGAAHQISHLIWAASGGVKGAAGRLSSQATARVRERERGIEGECQDGVSAREDRRGEKTSGGRGLKESKGSCREDVYLGPAVRGQRGGASMCCPLQGHRILSASLRRSQAKPLN